MDSGLSEADVSTITAVLKKFPTVETALLYGSRAMGTFRRGSDIDIALKGEQLSDDTCSRIHFELEEETLLPYFFDITHYASLENQNLKDHIDRVGVVFYQKQPEHK
jgi:predicted nucleotidyltransferase